MSRHGVVRTVLKALCVAATAAGGLAAIAPAPAGATAPTSVVLSHAVAIQDNEVIQVSGTGTPGESLVVTECGNFNSTSSTWNVTAGACSGFGNPLESKGAGTVDGTPIIVDASGNWGPVAMTIRRSWTNPNTGQTIVCRERNLDNAAVSCGIRVTSLVGGATQVDFHMAPKMTVTPSTDLVDGQTVSVQIIDMPSTVTTLNGGFTMCPLTAPYTSPVAGHGTAGQPLVFTDTGQSPTGFVPDYCGGVSPTGTGGGQGIGTAVQADGSISFNYVVHTGIFNSNYTNNGAPPACNAGDTCQIIGFTPGAGATKAATAPVTLAAATATPALTVDDVVGQTVNDAARAGDQLVLSGSDLDDGSAAISLCDVDGASNCASIGTGTVSSGALSATVTVPVGATTGLRTVKATSGSTSATTPLTVLGDPTVSAPASAPAGSTITVTGTEWNPTSTTTVLTFRDASDNAVGSPTPLTVSGIGGFSTNVVVPSGAVSIEAADGPLSASVPFSVASNDITCSGSPLSLAEPNDCMLGQQVMQEVVGGAFTFSQTSGLVTMGAVTLDGTDQTSTGSLADLSLVDARGSNAGWSLTATLTDFTDGTPSAAGNHVIARGNLSATPSCSATTGGTASPGTAGQTFSGVVTVCSSPPGDSAGQFVADADLALLVPATSFAGTYTATMTLLVV